MGPKLAFGTCEFVCYVYLHQRAKSHIFYTHCTVVENDIEFGLVRHYICRQINKLYMWAG